MNLVPNGETPLPYEPAWPAAEGRTTVLLVDASTTLEMRLIESWARRHAQGRYETIRIPSSRRRRVRRPDRRLHARLGRDDDPLVVPVKTVWAGPDRQGTRSVRITDLAKLGDPRDPDALRQYAILAMAPDRVRLVLGDGAGGAELREAWRSGSDTHSLGDFVARRAWLALERAERAFRGDRYKVPKFLHEEILRSGSFKDGIAHLADEGSRSYDSVHRQASRNLREIAAKHSPLVIDVMANLIHWLYRQGYNSLNYDASQLAEIYQMSEQHPLVFLPSHKSQLDRLVLQFMLWENDLPPNHTAGGINLNFFPVGPLIRRSGVFFIRRSFKDKPVYKFALQSYIDFLIEKRFPLEWYPEGGRSRSGKLLPPKFGMLTYVADSLRRDKAEDVILIPICIAYDQIQDVSDYAREQRGEAKEGESLTWLVKAVRSLRRRYGNVHIRFGEPISMAKELPAASDGTPPDSEEMSLALQKLAFEVMVRISRVTPITPTSAVTLALLASGRVVMTVDQIVESLSDLTSYVYKRRLPVTERVRLDGRDQVQEALDRLAEHDIVTAFTAGPEPVYRIHDDQYLTASYYRNTIVHYFVGGSIVELALVHLAAHPHSDPVECFWDEVMRLRDLLKFEFFFPDKESFRSELGFEMRLHDRQWQQNLEEGNSRQMLAARRPIFSTWALKPFMEAYMVVGDQLEREEASEEFDEAGFLARALELGKLYRLQEKISSEEAVSQVLFKSGLKLADNRGLLTGPGLAERRAAFAREIRDVIARIDSLA